MGQLDGAEDEARIKCCPPIAPIGPRPPFPAYPVCYEMGYWEAFSGIPHYCTEQCRRAQADREAG